MNASLAEHLQPPALVAPKHGTYLLPALAVRRLVPQLLLDAPELPVI